jgi:hypothetical protein
MRFGVFFSCLLLLPACATTAHERLGDVARYAPAYAGYVMGDADPVLLRHPLTHEKIRCREDLAPLAATLTEALEDEVRDRHVRRVADVALGPFTLVGRAAALLGAGLVFPGVAIVSAALSPGRLALYTQAREGFLAGRFGAARDLFEAVLLGHDGLTVLPLPWIERSVYYLGLSDEALGRPREAGEALRRFLTTAATPDEERYRDAEQRLARIEPGALPACRSRADLHVSWQRSP